jgi:hypothetical protein
MSKNGQSMFTRDPITGVMGITAANGDVDGHPNDLKECSAGLSLSRQTFG